MNRLIFQLLCHGGNFSIFFFFSSFFWGDSSNISWGLFFWMHEIRRVPVKASGYRLDLTCQNYTLADAVVVYNRWKKSEISDFVSTTELHFIQLLLSQHLQCFAWKCIFTDQKMMKSHQNWKALLSKFLPDVEVMNIKILLLRFSREVCMECVPSPPPPCIH